MHETKQVGRFRVPVPGTWAQLEAVVADLHAELLDRSRPLWMMYVLESLASGEHGVGLNITLMSYAGNLCLGFVVARCAVPDARQLADDFLDAFEELKQRMQKPERAPRKAPAAMPAATRTKVTRARASAAAPCMPGIPLCRPAKRNSRQAEPGQAK
ncbi:MAG: wax ester/triacylglycerol synthase family O-acyltransferase [Rhodocyclaceae bacterium]|nr:wax ester/triacylglycerol synthase family O-acyltransferase [Rhodocyclaceae bacterium]